MIKVFSRELIQTIDKESGVNKDLNYMQEAAAALVNIVETSYEDYINEVEELSFEYEDEEFSFDFNKEFKILIVAGAGNNGGDGILLAENLLQKQILMNLPAINTKHKDDEEPPEDIQIKNLSLELVICKQKDKLTETSKQAFELLAKTLSKYPELSESFSYSFVDEQLLSSLNILRKLRENEYDVIVDAMLGIGFDGELKEPYASYVQAINQYRKDQLNDLPDTLSLDLMKPLCQIISVDVPTGIHANRAICNNAIEADMTLTMNFNKISASLAPCQNYFGEIFIASINYPVEVLSANKTKIYVSELDDAAKMLPHRHTYGDKYSHGKALLIGSFKEMSGALCMSAASALKTGLGMLNCLSSSYSKKILDINIPEAINHSYEPGLASRLIEDEQFKNIGLGMALGYSEADSLALIKEIFSSLAKKPAEDVNLLLDADALNLYKDKLKELSELIKISKAKVLITPHINEFKRLFKPSNEHKDLLNLENADLAKLASYLLDLSMKHGFDILLKGPITFITDHRADKIYLIPHYQNALARAGSGDILSGLITGLMSQNLDLCDAAKLACHIHALAAKQASLKKSIYGISAIDIVYGISEAWTEMIFL